MVKESRTLKGDVKTWGLEQNQSLLLVELWFMMGHFHKPNKSSLQKNYTVNFSLSIQTLFSQSQVDILQLQVINP